MLLYFTVCSVRMRWGVFGTKQLSWSCDNLTVWVLLLQLLPCARLLLHLADRERCNFANRWSSFRTISYLLWSTLMYYSVIYCLHLLIWICYLLFMWYCLHIEFWKLLWMCVIRKFAKLSSSRLVQSRQTELAVNLIFMAAVYLCVCIVYMLDTFIKS